MLQNIIEGPLDLQDVGVNQREAPARGRRGLMMRFGRDIDRVSGLTPSSSSSFSFLLNSFTVHKELAPAKGAPDVFFHSLRVKWVDPVRLHI